jgi:DNA-binding transcriptional ArsR family regulator
MDEQDVVTSLAALAQPVRLRVFRALVVQGQSGMTPGTMAEGLGIPQNTLSFHLKELARAGLVTQERSSRYIVYRAAFDRMNALLGYLTENCCRGDSCTTADAARAGSGCGC